MEARIYIKQYDERQTMFVATNSLILKSEHFLTGKQVSKNGVWEEWNMRGKNLCRMLERGQMVRIQ